MDNLHVPHELYQAYVDASFDKSNTSWKRLMVMSIFAGMFIALGAQASMVVSHDIANYGIAKLISGIVFPIGLMMIVLVGGELFTGNCLMIMAIMNKKIMIRDMVRVQALVFFFNLFGAIFIALLVAFSGQWDNTGGQLGAYTIKMALTKSQLHITDAFISGTLCNIMVCVAMLMGKSSRDVTGKILAIFFPIMAFVVSGFEHCVANMYYIPAGMIASQNSEYIQVAQSVYGITQLDLSHLNIISFVFNNLLPVTLGNIFGGAVCVGVLYALLYQDINK